MRFKRRLSRYVLGQANVIAVIVLVGAALALGLTMLTYFTSTSIRYRSVIELLNRLNYESVNQVLRLITVNKSSEQVWVWILLKKLDNSNTPFFIAVEADGNYLGCENVLRYDSSKDLDGILCSSDGDCVQAQTISAGVDVSRVYALMEQGVSDFLTYARTKGYPVIPPKGNNICVLNVNSYGMTIAVLKTNAQVMRIHLLTIVNNIPYVINTYEVRIG